MKSECLQFLSGLESNRLTGRNSYFGTGPRISPDTGFSGSDVEDSETAQLNPVAVRECSFHGFEYCFHSHLSFGLSYAGAVHDFVDDV